MTAQYASVAELRQTISIEVLVALGLPRRGVVQRLLQPLVWPPAHRFARLAAEFDRRTALSGIVEALRWVVPRFVQDVRAHGAERLPATGPLLVVSNHPGSYDGLLIGSLLGRDDLKVVVTDVPFLRSMYGTSPHLIYTAKEPHARMGTVRESVRHLRAGGALLIFPSGQVDPDPALLPGAQAALQKWSPSLSLFLRQVPEINVLITIVSGVLASSCFRHPLTLLRKEQRLKQFLAEFLQISQQMLFGRRFPLTPTVRFAAPLSAAELDRGHDSQATLSAITERAQTLLLGSGLLG